MNTKVREFNGIIQDRVFKVFFKNKNTLIDFLNSYFEFVNSDRKVRDAEVDPQIFIASNNVKKKDYYGDVLATLDNGELVLIEAYTNFGMREYKKSNNYLARIYSNQMNYGDNDYSKCKKCMCLNLVQGNFRRVNHNLVNIYIPMNKRTKKIIDEGEIELVLIRLDLVNNSLYSDSNKRFIRWLKIINAQSFEEMQKYVEGDKIMQDSIEYLKRYHRELDHGIQDIIDEEVFLADERARKEERKETKLNIAKNLLSLDMDVNDIVKATGLSKKQIQKLMN